MMRGTARLLARPHPCQIRLHLRDRAWRGDRSQINDGPETVYEAGQSFSEPPPTATASAPMAARPSRPSSSRCSSWTQRDGTDGPTREL